MRHDPKREIIARAVLMAHGRVLANRSHNQKTDEEYFALPGGHVDPGESCAAALAREFREELGVNVIVGDLCFVSESIYPGRRTEDTRRHELVLYFRAELNAPLAEKGGRIRSPEHDKQFEWIQVTDLPTVNLLPAAVKQFLVRSEGTEAAPESLHYVFEDSTTG